VGGFYFSFFIFPIILSLLLNLSYDNKQQRNTTANTTGKHGGGRNGITGAPVGTFEESHCPVARNSLELAQKFAKHTLLSLCKYIMFWLDYVLRKKTVRSSNFQDVVVDKTYYDGDESKYKKKGQALTLKMQLYIALFFVIIMTLYLSRSTVLYIQSDF